MSEQIELGPMPPDRESRDYTEATIANRFGGEMYFTVSKEHSDWWQRAARMALALLEDSISTFDPNTDSYANWMRQLICLRKALERAS